MASYELALDVTISPDADEDLWGIWESNLGRHGNVERADDYDTFLRTGIMNLATAYSRGLVIPEIPDLRYLISKKSSSGYGHHVIYRIDPSKNVVKVLRVYHSRMDIVGRLRAQFG